MTEPVGLRLRGQPTGEYDDYGNPEYGPPTTKLVYGWIEPRTSGENTNAREQQTYGYWVNLPLDAPLAGADAVVLFGLPDNPNQTVTDGEEYHVIGEPGRQPGGFLVPGFIKAAVEKVTG
ncbi:hypothetical protein AB0K08_13570 [Citricoccus sp. NPDC055426]|uniref:hypothetical protein n=1 Tax=Citricoccus sp. NPDC055426 TaxID=3155536 RepID=UPI003434B128